jgi:arsenite methyltransferase
MERTKEDAGAKPQYGADGFPYIVGLGSAAIILGLLGVAGLLTQTGRTRIAAGVALVVSIGCAVPAMLGIRYVLKGKFELRDKLLELVDVHPEHVVADFGSGTGLLGIGAAKAGAARVHCIDLFIAKDLSGNSQERLLRNARIEGVGNHIELHLRDVRDTGLSDESVDIVMSTLCIHNIASSDDRREALEEMHRVLRPGGRIVISDLAHVDDEYEPILRSLGLQIDALSNAASTFPPQKILLATKGPAPT